MESGTRYAKVDCRSLELVVPLEVFRDHKKLSDYLALHGVFLPNPAKDIVALRVELEDAPIEGATRVIENVGWSGTGHYCWPDGTVSSVDDEWESLVPSCGSDNGVAGSLENWLKDFARHLEGQHIPIFAICFALVPLLRPFNNIGRNPGVQLIGRAGIGKSSTLIFASSVSRAPFSENGGVDMVQPSELLAKNGTDFMAWNDQLLAIDDVQLVGAGLSARAAGSEALRVVNALRLGTQKDGKGPNGSFCYLMAGTRPISRPQQSPSLHLPLHIPCDKPYGIFTHCDGHGERMADYVDDLSQAAAKNHGHVARQFVEQLLKRGGVVAELKKYVDEARRKLNADLSNGDQLRDIDIFATTYAAGKLAQKFRLLPKEWKIGSAVRHCIKLAECCPRLSETPDQMVLRLAKDKKAIEITAKRPNRPACPKKLARIEEAPLYIKQCASGENEVWVRPSAIANLWPGWKRQHKTPEVRSLIKSEGGRLQNKRRIWRDGEPERFFVFRLPEKSPTLLGE